MSAKACNLRTKKLAAGLSAAFALIGVQAHAFASVVAVTSCSDDNSAGTLRQVAAGASSGDEIDLSHLSCKQGTITLTQGEIVIPHNATLLGAVGSPLTITNSNGRVLHSTSSDAPSSFLDVVNLNLSGGRVYTDYSDASGGCLLVSGNLSLVGSTVSDCVANASGGFARGGAINAQSVSLVSSQVSGSIANASGGYQSARGGGIYATSLACADSTLTGNNASAEASGGSGQGGGALVPNGDVDLARCTVDSNTAGEGGGIMQFVNRGYSPLTRIQSSTISGNTATYASGGIEVFCPDCTPAPVQILNSTFLFNYSAM